RISELAEQLDTAESTVEACLLLLHRLEPIGLGARDIQECLLLQAKHHYPDNKSMHLIIENHIKELADKRWDTISQSLSMTLMDIKHIADLIVTLNPKPCIGLFNFKTEFLFPDITIREEYGEYIVTLSDAYLPKITLNQDYFNLKNTHPQASSYIKSKYQNYLWMINSIEQRQSTIMKIAV